MTYYDLRLSEADDPHYSYNNGHYDGNIPRNSVNFSLMGNLFECIKARRMLESDEYGGKVLDWGSSGAKLRKPDVIGFLNWFFTDEERKREALSKIEDFPDDRLYILFAVET